jgi:hypothetical protein
MRLIFTALVIVTFTSCAKKESTHSNSNSTAENSAIADSIKASRLVDSLRTIQVADSLKATHLADSLKRVEDSLARVKPTPIINKPIPIHNEPRPMKKPIIYLYPETSTEITVRFQAFGDIIATYPEYNNGWKVRATPEGKLTDLSDGQPHNYLFYECELPHAYKLESGFLVSADSTIPFLQKSLKHIGLLPSEYNDMISYWLPQLKKNPWNVIHFTLNEDYDKLSTLEVIPAPDSELRVMMEFVGLDAPVSLPVQALPHFERKGFVVVEWGGIEFSKENLSVVF